MNVPFSKYSHILRFWETRTSHRQASEISVRVHATGWWSGHNEEWKALALSLVLGSFTVATGWQDCFHNDRAGQNANEEIHPWARESGLIPLCNGDKTLLDITSSVYPGSFLIEPDLRLHSMFWWNPILSRVSLYQFSKTPLSWVSAHAECISTLTCPPVRLPLHLCNERPLCSAGFLSIAF